MVVLFVGQSCCSTHESVLSLFSSELITHENMLFFGWGWRGGKRTGDFLRSDEVDRISRAVASQERNVKHGRRTLELALNALTLACFVAAPQG